MFDEFFVVNIKLDKQKEKICAPLVCDFFFFSKLIHKSVLRSCTFSTPKPDKRTIAEIIPSKELLKALILEHARTNVVVYVRLRIHTQHGSAYEHTFFCLARGDHIVSLLECQLSD